MKEYVKKNLTKEPPKDSNLKVGDTVNWANDYGIKWTHKIIGFNYNGWFQAEYKKFVHLDSDAFWFPHDHKTLTKIK